MSNDGVRSFTRNRGKILAALLLVALFALWASTRSPPTPRVKRATPHAKAGPVLILLHGHGAPGDDLKPLARRLIQQVPGLHCYVPPAPHPFGNGRTWYFSVPPEGRASLDPHTLQLRAEARAVVFDVIDQLLARGVKPQQIYVGGFSQGATVALDVVLSERGKGLAGLVSLSGGALELDLDALAQRPGLRAFISHGRNDPVLSDVASKRLAEVLKTTGHEVQFVPFDGGHAVPPEVVGALAGFLRNR